MNPIFTRLHKLAELVEAVDIPKTEHHYVIGADLMLAMPRADVQRSIAAMIDAGMARLPFPELLVEFSVDPSVTRFLWLRERPQDDAIEATTIMLTSKGLATVPLEPAQVVIQGGALAVRDCSDARDAQAIALGTSFALLMLNVKGVDKVRIEPKGLNRAREKSGKGPVPTHHVLRIGVVYDRAGKAVQGAGQKTVYLRAGHVRMQACGPGWREHRRIYVNPVLVNYREGDETPAARPRVVKMGGRA